MSADNWGHCPRCKQKHDSERARKIAAAKSSYGKGPPFDYNAALNEANAIPLAPAETLREDYEQGTQPDGTFYVSYGCHCEVCGFTFKFNHEENTLDRATTEDWG